LLVSATAFSFFCRLVQTTGAYRLGEGVALDAQPVGHLRRLQPLVEQPLCLAQHRCGQHRRPAALAGFVEAARPLFAVTLHRPLEADLRHTECAHDVHLLGIAVHTELRGDHLERSPIRFVVHEHRHAAVEVGHAPTLLAERQHRGDLGHARREDRKLDLRHHLSPCQQHKSATRRDTPCQKTKTGIFAESGCSPVPSMPNRRR
jgi:hypothetical protein